jgi:hypothetical protein
MPGNRTAPRAPLGVESLTFPVFAATVKCVPGPAAVWCKLHQAGRAEPELSQSGDSCIIPLRLAIVIRSLTRCALFVTTLISQKQRMKESECCIAVDLGDECGIVTTDPTQGFPISIQ